jgi:hypothetical protein
MIKTFAQCSGDHKLDVSTEFPMDQGWVIGYVEYPTDDIRGSSISQDGQAPRGTGARKRICIEAWADGAAYKPNVGHYCSVACAVADLERALVTRRYNGAESRDPDLPSATIPYRVYRAEAYSNQPA